jgi:septal ring-binding cell division protein DamX
VLFFYKDDYSVDTKVSQLNVLDEQSREVIISDLEINDENTIPKQTEKNNTSLEKQEEIFNETQEVIDETELFSNNFLKDSLDWLNIQKPSYWLVQLSSFDTFNKALLFSKKFKDIEIRIVEYSHPKKKIPYYAVIIGSFVSLETAKDFSKGKLNNVDPFYRTVKSLKIYIK